MDLDWHAESVLVVDVFVMVEASLLKDQLTSKENVIVNRRFLPGKPLSCLRLL